MSLTGDNTAKFWASCPKILGHRRRSSSSGLFNINITEPILAKYKQLNHLAKLHSDSSALGLNAVNKPGLPRGTLFRSSLPATPLTSPMYTSIMHQFTEKAIQDLLGKSSTPKVVKSSSDYELKIDNQQQSGQKMRTNLFDLSSDTQNIITRGSLVRPKTLDIKNKIKLESNLAKINENGKDELDKVSLSVYHSIKEEQEEQDDCLEVNNKSGDKLNKNDSKLNESNKVTSNKLNEENNDHKIVLEKNNEQKDINLEINKSKEIKLETNKTTNNSTIETIVLDDSSIDKTVQSISKISIKEQSNLNNDKLIEHNGVHNNLKDKEIEQQNCLFIKNLPNSLNNDEIRDYFKTIGLNGQITKVYIPRNNITKIQKNFGFVTFENEKDVQKILNMPKENLKFKGRSIQVSLAKNKKK